ncbi:threonine/homoserine/homoserine lactone efflux protein [Acinetobacter calcoaceticus]|uniref:Threonine/homoserine/homoserine lactone efflux protein n=1 Tax=Acinetobacter calcoaceticus TaxID=471 RepID=A0A4R1YA55_ACICA|nr:threonine/homoserine/homoserine lactone efflux protein [Acinetobacter calcoaceticus]
MLLPEQLAYIATCIFAAATPGPGTLTVINASIHMGVKRTLPLIFGILSGLALVAILAMFGLVILVLNSKIAFYGVQSLGGLYILYLGVMCFLNARRNQTIEHSSTDMKSFTFLSGLVISVINPKTLIFFSALLPAFINTQQNYIAQNIYLSIILLICTLSVHLCYAKLGSYSAQFLLKQHRKVDIISGALFMLLAVFIGWDIVQKL